MFGFGKKKLIGLDLGAHSVKIAEVKMDSNGRGATLVNFAIAHTPADAINMGEIKNTQLVGQVVQSLLVERKIKIKDTATSLSGSAVIVKKISIAQVEESLLEEHLRWEAEQYIPYDINEVSLAHQLIRSTSQGGQMDILLVAAQKEAIMRSVEVLMLAGLSCTVVDVAGFALANCFEFNYGSSNTEPIALLNLGSHISNFVIVYGGEVLLSRDVMVGGLTYTTEIQKDMGMSLQEAEALKISTVNRGDGPQELMNIIKHVNENIAEEIKSSFEFASTATGSMEIRQCFYTGGTSAMPGLPEQLRDSIGVTFNLLDPFRRIRPGANYLSSGYLQHIRSVCAIPLGLALRKVGE